jgi:glycosyltransferase 2 family protein
VLARTDLRWELVGLSAIVMLATYALLVEGWRRVLAALGGALGPADAARVWFVASLARYMPGWFWALGAMTELARRRGVPVTVSTSSAVVINIVHVFSGLVVATAFAATTPAILDSDRARLLLLAGVVVLLAMPVLAPRLVGVARHLTGRELAIPRVGMRAVVVAALSTALAWLTYGVAFWLLATGVLPGGWRDLPGCIALYTLSYLVGLFNPAPAGIGAAEGAMVLLAPQLGVATSAEAAVLAVVVRVWRTVLEIAPGLLALAFGGSRLEEPDQPSRGSRIP